jgi:hypothetical protein
MESKISFGSIVKQYNQALSLIQAKLDSLHAPIRIAEHLAREAALNLRLRNFIRILVGVFTIAAIIGTVLSVYALRVRDTELGMASHTELQPNSGAPEPSLLEVVEHCPYTRSIGGVFGNNKLNNLLRITWQNDPDNQGKQESSDSSTLSLGEWTEKENSNIRRSDTSTCMKQLKKTEGEPDPTNLPEDE